MIRVPKVSIQRVIGEHFRDIGRCCGRTYIEIQDPREEALRSTDYGDIKQSEHPNPEAINDARRHV